MYVPGGPLASHPVPTPFQSGPNVPWVSEGPSPGINGQQGNLQLEGLATDGAIQAIAVNPTNTNIMYVATVNGGIWLIIVRHQRSYAHRHLRGVYNISKQLIGVSRHRLRRIRRIDRRDLVVDVCR
jgi:hypothetical protein